MNNLDFTPIPQDITILRGPSWQFDFRLPVEVTNINLNDFTIKAYIWLNNSIIETLNAPTNIVIAENGKSFFVKKEWVNGDGTVIDDLISGTLQMQILVTDAAGRDYIPAYFNIHIVEKPTESTERASFDTHYVINVVDGAFYILGVDSLYNLTVEASEEAEQSATLAGQKATIATDKATIATEKAGIATQKATDAANSAEEALAYKNTAYDEAVIATQKAGEANTAKVAAQTAQAVAEAKAIESANNANKFKYEDSEDIIASIENTLRQMLVYWDTQGYMNALFRLQANAVEQSNIANNAVSLQKLDTNLQNLLAFLSAFSENDNESGNLFEIFTTARQYILQITSTGFLKALFDYSLSPIQKNDLGTDLQNSVFNLLPFDPEFDDYIFTIEDKVRKLLAGIRYSDGKLVAEGITITIPDSSVTYQKLSSEYKKLLPYFGGKMLCIGDSVTAAGLYQTTIAEKTGMAISTHAKGGIGILAMVDGDGASTSPILPLSAAQIQDKDIVSIFGGLNERSTTIGTRGDMYPTQNTLYGRYNYTIQKIYTLAASVNRKDVRIVLITPHCVGKYNYIDADGYSEYPIGSGRTLETLVNAITDIGGQWGIPVIDLYHNSGINKNNWDILTANTISGNGTYPSNADNVHPNTAGYIQIGKYISTQINQL